MLFVKRFPKKKKRVQRKNKKKSVSAKEKNSVLKKRDV
jgi:hypothetical protein